MSPQRISYIAITCLFLIFFTQAYLVFDHFQNTRASLSRESNAIIEDAFRKELNQRNTLFKHLAKEDTITVSAHPKSENTYKFKTNQETEKSENGIGFLDLAINSYIGKTLPLNLHNLDSVTKTILESRNIKSEFIIKIVDPSTGKVLEHSYKKIESTLLMVPSKLLKIDLDNQKALQLVLVNPFGLIIKRMGLMLISSLIFSIICLLAFRFLLRILAGQKQLVSFKNEFLATIAHELKRPVASLSFNLDCLSMPSIIANTVQREVLVQKSMHATMELNATINMIVALAKMEEGLLVLNKEPIDLKDLFEDLKARFMTDSGKRVVIQTVYELEECTVTGDAQLLSQCFANLIDNAIKYSNKEVLIIISLQKTGKWIIVSIKDNGYGIAEEKMPVIFDKYTRANPNDMKINGYGIGLNYVKTIVEKHKGEVEVKSQLGEGSEFSVLLPE